MARHKNIQWSMPEGIKSATLTTHSWDSIHTSLLMDIRDELQQLNQLLHCGNFIAIPRKLDAIQRNTARPKRQPRKQNAEG